MKTLILCSNDLSENIAAGALSECFERHGEKCEIRGVLSFVPGKASGAAKRSGKYKKFCAKEPHSGGADLSQIKSRPAVPGRLNKESECGKMNLGQYILDGAFDLVICAGRSAAMLFAAAREHYRLGVTCAFLETGFFGPSGDTELSADVYFLPDPSLAPGSAAAWADESKIVFSGIPIPRDLIEHTDKQEAKKRLGIGQEKQHILILAEDIDEELTGELIIGLYFTLRDNVEVSIVCGKNKRAYGSLVPDFGHLGNIHIRDGPDDLPVLMDSADLLVTKPGGSALAAAAVRSLPVILADTGTNAEKYGAEQVVRRGMALSAQNAEAVCQLCKELLNDPARMKQMAEKISEIASGNAAETIYETLTSLPRADETVTDRHA